MPHDNSMSFERADDQRGFFGVALRSRKVECTATKSLWLAAVIATILESGPVSVSTLDRDLRKRHPFLSREEVYAAIALAVASGRAERKYGGAMIERAATR